MSDEPRKQKDDAACSLDQMYKIWTNHQVFILPRIQKTSIFGVTHPPIAQHHPLRSREWQIGSRTGVDCGPGPCLTGFFSPV